jgi:hypothetical protein
MLYDSELFQLIHFLLHKTIKHVGKRKYHLGAAS